MLTGSCLCGGVRYEIDGAIEKITNCHCSLCRTMSGSAFSSGATMSKRMHVESKAPWVEIQDGLT